MWIKWEYKDHGAGGFKELEVPEWAMKEYPKQDDCVKSYICDKRLVPVWSERFSPDRIKWKRIKSPNSQTLLDMIKNHKQRAAHYRKESERLGKLLKTL